MANRSCKSSDNEELSENADREIRNRLIVGTIVAFWSNIMKWPSQILNHQLHDNINNVKS